jgi:hypothetical protein
VEGTTTRILGLSDGDAIAALAAVTERRGFASDASARTIDERLRQAFTQQELAELVPTPERCGQGEVARATMLELARRDQAWAADIARAMELPSARERFDPATLAVGALVLFAFHAEVELRKDPSKGWYFHFHTKPLRDSAVSSILAKLFGALD